jgi:hypothetical protein
MIPSGLRDVSGCRSHRQQNDGRRGWQYRYILPLLAVSCAPVGGNETWMTDHLACRPIARQGACVSAHHFSGPRVLSIFPPWDAHERAGEAVVGWQNRLMSGLRCAGCPLSRGPPIYSVPTTVPRDGRRRRLVDGRALANRMPCHPLVSRGKSSKMNISTRPLFQESWSGNSGRSGTVDFLPVDQRLPPAQHSRRIRDGSRHTPAPPLRVADETRHLANVPLIMLLRVSTHSADGSGWMGGRLQMLTVFRKGSENSFLAEAAKGYHGRRRRLVVRSERRA